jgi:hypothetical protein
MGDRSMIVSHQQQEAERLWFMTKPESPNTVVGYRWSCNCGGVLDYVYSYIWKCRRPQCGRTWRLW